MKMKHFIIMGIMDLYNYPLFSWENLKIELEHPDELEENIFF